MTLKDITTFSWKTVFIAILVYITVVTMLIAVYSFSAWLLLVMWNAVFYYWLGIDWLKMDFITSMAIHLVALVAGMILPKK